MCSHRNVRNILNSEWGPASCSLTPLFTALICFVCYFHYLYNLISLNVVSFSPCNFRIWGFLCSFYFVFERVLLWSPDCPGAHPVKHARLDLLVRQAPRLCLLLMGLQVYATYTWHWSTVFNDSQCIGNGVEFSSIAIL